MTTRKKPQSVSGPQWDGTRVIFQIEVAGQIVDCAISRTALQDLGGWRHFSPADLLRCFSNAQDRIERAAAEKFAAQAESVYGVVSIWSDDLEDVPPVLTGDSHIGSQPHSQPQGKTNNGKGTKAQQSRGEKAEGEQEASAGTLVVPAPGVVAGGKTS